MKQFYFIVLIQSLSSCVLNIDCQSCEYLYPVGYLPSQKKLLLTYQTNQKETELFSWDVNTRYLNKDLSSFYSPMGVQVLPNDIGFSFIRNGKIYVKKFFVRSTRCIHLDDMIYDVNHIFWKNEETFYCSAKKDKRYAIFKGNFKEDCDCVLSSNEHDYLYPYIVGEELFCLKREKEFKYSIILLVGGNEIVLTDLEQKNISHFNVINKDEIFFLNFNKKEKSSYLFDYFLWKRTQHEKPIKLFTFSIPQMFLEEGLCETFLPFLPKCLGNKILFVSESLNFGNISKTSIFEFDLIKTQSLEVFSHVDRSLFGIMPAEDRIFFGGAFCGSQIQKDNVEIQIQKDKDEIGSFTNVEIDLFDAEYKLDLPFIYK